jgi:hypothetical protein
MTRRPLVATEHGVQEMFGFRKFWRGMAVTVGMADLRCGDFKLSKALYFALICLGMNHMAST